MTYNKMLDEKYIDAILTYKYTLLIIKELQRNNTSIDHFDSMVLEYRENLSSVCNGAFIDMILTEDNIKTQESDNIDTYSILAIEHYLKFIREFSYTSGDFKDCGKKLLRKIKCVMDSDYELPSWCINNK